MNIGIFLESINPDLGGNYTFQNSLVRALETVETNHNFFVFYSSNKEMVVSGSQKVVYVNLFNDERRASWVIRYWQKLLCRQRGDSVGKLQEAVAFWNIDLVWFVNHSFEKIDIPYIFTVLDLEHRVHPFFPEVSVTGSTWENREMVFGTMIPRAAYVISGTEAGRRQIIDFYHPDPDRVRVIPFPVSSFALEKKEIDQSVIRKHGLTKPYLFYPAQFWPHKNHIVLLHTVKLLREKYRFDIAVVFCGSDKGNLNYIKETARDLGVENHVRFLGFVSFDELYALYNDAFALVFPSIFGPDNLPPLEAFILGCPVIAANVAGAVEQLGDAAILIDPLREESIARAVMHLYEEPESREDFVRKGKKRAKSMIPHGYVQEIVSLCDEFELYRRCWSSKERYVHS